MIFGDLPAAFLPIVPGHDRGTELETTWKELDGIRIWGDLRARELQGILPSIVFSPMLVEDGRRLLITNLDFGDLVTTAGEMIVDEDTSGQYGSHFSVASVPFFELFPMAVDFRLSTAVRISRPFRSSHPQSVCPRGRHAGSSTRAITTITGWTSSYRGSTSIESG